MNILAHLHLATLANSSLIGNTVADFVKGNPYSIYPQNIADGIMLHRKIDAMVDSLSEVKSAKLRFRKTHQRVAPITLDLVWDHFLSRDWFDFHPTCSVSEFNDKTKAIIKPTLSSYPIEYQHFMNAMWQYQWLKNYSDVDFIGRVLVGMANRRPKLSLLEETIVDFEQNYHELESIFRQLYPKMIKFVQSNSI